MLRVGELRGRSAPPGRELTGEREDDRRRSLCARRVHRGKVNATVGQQAQLVTRNPVWPHDAIVVPRGTFGWAAALWVMQVVPSWLVQAKEAVC